MCIRDRHVVLETKKLDNAKQQDTDTVKVNPLFNTLTASRSFAAVPGSSSTETVTVAVTDTPQHRPYRCDHRIVVYAAVAC